VIEIITVQKGGRMIGYKLVRYGYSADNRSTVTKIVGSWPSIGTLPAPPPKYLINELSEAERAEVSVYMQRLRAYARKHTFAKKQINTTRRKKKCQKKKEKLHNCQTQLKHQQ
jgi:hypothetical protein